MVWAVYGSKRSVINDSYDRSTSKFKYYCYVLPAQHQQHPNSIHRTRSVRGSGELRNTSKHNDAGDTIQNKVGRIEYLLLRCHFYVGAQDFLQTNKAVQYGGSRAMLKKESLFRFIATNNSILSDIMISLGTVLLLSAFSTATSDVSTPCFAGVLNRASALEWRIDNYYKLWENLREEFELKRRFESVEDKVCCFA